METCANPGCDQPGTNKCSGCKTTPYCGPNCQKAHWVHHKEECNGHLRKMGMAYLVKANRFHHEQNWSQTLRYSDLAVTKLKQMKDRPVEAISDALSSKCTALGFLGQDKEQLECAKEWYCLWNTKPADPPAIRAAFALIQSCMANKEFVDAHLYASTLWEIINHKHDNKIPDDQRQLYTAKGAYYFARATLELSKSGGIPSEEKQKTGQEVIALLRQALEIHTRLRGTDNDEAASDMVTLAEALDHFNDVDDEEVLRLYEQATIIYVRLQGNSGANVAICKGRLADTYVGRAGRANAVNNRDHELANLELALPRLRESARIYRTVNRTEMADDNTRAAVELEEMIRRITIARAAAAAAATATKG